MKILIFTLAAVLGAHTVAQSEDSAPSSDRQQDPIVLSIEHVEDTETPGTFVTCVTCSVRGATNTETMEPTGRAWIELITVPVPGIQPQVFARRSALRSEDTDTGRTLFYGFFPGAHGTHSGHWPNLIIEIRPKGAKDDTQNVRLSIFRALNAEESADVTKLDNIDVPEAYRERIPPPRVHRQEREILPRKRPIRPIPSPTQPATPEPKSAPKATPEAPAAPVPKEQPKPRRGAPPQQRNFATDNIA